MTSPGAARPTPAPVDLNIEIDDLEFSYGPRSHRLHDVSLSVGQGELCCLLGPNGAGKTTLIRCLLGFLTPHSGTSRLAGHDIAGLSRRELARLVAYVPQTTTTVFPFTALDMVVMGRTPHIRIIDTPSAADRGAAQLMLERLGIGQLAERSFAQLSGGERQLTMLARALVQEAPVLVLDEPTAALDYGNEVGILQVVSDLIADGRSVLMSTHQPNHALTWADSAVLMQEGTVVASGRASEVVTAPRLKGIYGVPIQIASVPSSTHGGGAQLVCLPDVRPRQQGPRDQAPRLSPVPPAGRPTDALDA